MARCFLRSPLPLASRLVAALLVPAAALLAAAVGAAAPPGTFIRIATHSVGPEPHVALARTPDGKLHLLYPTTAAVNGADGIATMAISASGTIGPEVQALAGWKTALPGLVALPNGTLTAVFGAIPPGNVPDLWSIGSTSGGASWSAPAAVGSGTLENLAYASELTGAQSGSTTVLTVPQAGNVVIQQGLGHGSPTQQVTDGSDNFAVDVESAVDAGGQVVASWQSLAGSGGLWMRAVAPSLGAPQLTPGQHRPALVVAGRDSGSGVFAAYTADGTHVGLVRYGGGTVPVGSFAGVTANALGVATGKDGRIWVMWGSEGGGIAVTRSNKAVTTFEPIQHLNHQSFTLYRLYGDGRTGPLDLFSDEVPKVPAGPGPVGTFYTRVLPVLSVQVSVAAVKQNGKVVAHKLTVHVTDAGDPVAGAKVSVKLMTKKTSGAGTAMFTLPGSITGSVTVNVTAGGYKPAGATVTL